MKSFFWILGSGTLAVSSVFSWAAAGAFLLDIRVGIVAWLAEVPQELGDFGALVHSGLTKKRALSLNLVSALAFPLGGMAAFAMSFKFNTDFLIAFRELF